MLVVILLVLGLGFGSFVNALVWRLRQQETKTSNPSIVNGRSMCPSCRHQLAARDLVPIFSWLSLSGRCRYCHQPISAQYPLVEAIAAVVFVSSYIFWPVALHGAGQIDLFVTWLAASIGLLALAIYDSRWMILPSKIIYPAAAVAIAGRLAYVIGFESAKIHAAITWILGIAVASGLFWVLFTVSSGKWIGYGDVRLGLVTGTLLASPAKSFLMIFVASLAGSVFILPQLLAGRRKADSKLSYGPFLIAATFIVLLFGDSIINYYKDLVL